MKINDWQFIELYGDADEAHPFDLTHVCCEANGVWGHKPAKSTQRTTSGWISRRAVLSHQDGLPCKQ